MPAEAGAATVTIIVAPGERFSLAPRSLRSLAAHTAPPFRLVYVDAGSPVAVRNEIAALAARHGFTVIRNERPLPPNQARNSGSRRRPATSSSSPTTTCCSRRAGCRRCSTARASPVPAWCRR